MTIKTKPYRQPRFAGRAPRDLCELLASLQACDRRGLPIAHGEIDWAALPTYGGAEPRDTREIWSWDPIHLLVGSCADDLVIVTRAEHAVDHEERLAAADLALQAWNKAHPPGSGAR